MHVSNGMISLLTIRCHCVLKGVVVIETVDVCSMDRGARGRCGDLQAILS